MCVESDSNRNDSNKENWTSFKMFELSLSKFNMCFFYLSLMKSLHWYWFN